MVEVKKIYTKLGDDKETRLFDWKKIEKDSIRIEAQGTLDELNSCLGVAATSTEDKYTHEIIKNLQQDILIIGAEVSNPTIYIINEEKINEIELLIDSITESLPALKKFIIPSGTQVATNLHLARTICRKAERRLISLSKSEFVNKPTLIYMNRLSDLLFNLARLVNKKAGIDELEWNFKSD